MNTEQLVERDERTVAVQNAACKWGFFSLYLGILLDCLYRHKVWHEGSGDLFVVLGVGVAVTTVYMIRHKATAPPLGRKKFFIVSVVAIFLVAFLLSLI
jgi:hypothetical protein